MAPDARLKSALHLLERNRILRSVVTVSFLIILLLAVIFNSLAGRGGSPFKHTVNGVVANYSVSFTPEGYTYAIWTIVYVSLIIIALYGLTLLFREFDYDDPMRYGASVSVSFMVVASLSLLFNFSWVFPWDKGDVISAAVLFLFMAILNSLAMFLMAFSFSRIANQLFFTSPPDFYIGVACENGYAFYFMWTVLATILHFGIALVYSGGYSDNTVSVVLLSFLLVVVMVVFALENTIWFTFFNPVFTHYFVYVFITSGMYCRNSTTSSSEVVGLLIANLSLASIFLSAKLIIIGVRNWRCSHYGDKFQNASGVLNSSSSSQSLSQRVLENGRAVRQTLRMDKWSTGPRPLFSHLRDIGLWEGRSHARTVPEHPPPTRHHMNARRISSSHGQTPPNEESIVPPEIQ